MKQHVFRDLQFAYISVTFLFTSNTRFQDRHTHFYGTFAFSDVFLAKQARRLIMSAVPCLFGPLFCNLAVFLILTFSSDLCMTELLITGRGGAGEGELPHTHTFILRFFPLERRSLRVTLRARRTIRPESWIHSS